MRVVIQQKQSARSRKSIVAVCFNQPRRELLTYDSQCLATWCISNLSLKTCTNVTHEGLCSALFHLKSRDVYTGVFVKDGNSSFKAFTTDTLYPLPITRPKCEQGCETLLSKLHYKRQEFVIST